MRKFDEILKSHPESPRALWGRGLVYDKQAEQQRSNELLEEGIALMDKAFRLPKVPDELLMTIGTKLADRQQFRGTFLFILYTCTVKPVLSGHSKIEKTKILMKMVA